jgi:hypothetical protein
MLKRELYLSRIRGFYDSDLVKILVGIRRCGKSVILKQIINELREKSVDNEHIIYVNFELIEYEDLQDYKELNKYIKEKIVDKKKYYIFLDEIQKVEKFEDVVNSLRASIENISIFITGSNSKLLSNEISTVLSGRYVLFNIYPLSYKEFIELTGKDGESEETFWNFVKWGGLPNRTQFTDESNIKDYLHSVFDSIILRDVVERLGLKDTALFDLLLQYVIDTTGREFSAENVVYNELLERGYEVYIGKTKKGKIDFIATKADEKLYIQVAYLLADDKVITREFGAYDDVNDNHPKYVISLDKTDFSQSGIIHKNIIDWLLEK